MKLEKTLNKYKGHFAFILTASGLLAIAVLYVGYITPLEFGVRDVLAAEVENIAYKEENTLYGANLNEFSTIREHVWYLLTQEGGLSFDEAIKGMAIVECESHFDPYAINFQTKDFGLWQINERYHDIGRECSFDVYCSTRYAIQLYKKWGNWSAWTCN